MLRQEGARDSSEAPRVGPGLYTPQAKPDILETKRIVQPDQRSNGQQQVQQVHKRAINVVEHAQTLFQAAKHSKCC